MKKLKKRTVQFGLLIKYIISFILLLFIKKYKNAWIISERGDDACDNGYVFYKYMKKNHPSKKIYYVIEKKSPRRFLINENDIINHKSIYNFVAFMSGKFLISTHIMGYTPDHGMFEKLDNKGLVYTRGKRIFLQHGVIKDYIPTLTNKKIDLFITSSDSEAKFVMENNNYSSKVVKSTGLARFDNLNSHNKENYILVMPTWRRYLYYTNLENFKDTNFYKNWRLFLYNKKLNEVLINNKIKIKFVPHPELTKYLSLFESIENIEIVDLKKTTYQELIKNCSMLVTDYSSIYFDVAYQFKPVIHYEFDRDEFNKGHYEAGYFMPYRDGFGDVVNDYKTLIDKVIKCIPNFEMEEKYSERVKGFFKHKDNNNCKRIYYEIMKLYDNEKDYIVLSQYKKNERNAGPKAKVDIENILREAYGYTIRTFPLQEEQLSIIKKIYRIIKKRNFTKKSIKGYKEVIVQAPYSEKSFVIGKIKNMTIIIHDIEGLRTRNDKQLRNEISFYKKANRIIVHNSKMKEFLIEQGINHNSIFILEMFDYLCDNENKKEIIFDQKNIRIGYAGNLSKNKSPFIHQLDDKEMKFNLYLYGVGIDNDLSQHIKYVGSFKPDELPKNMNVDLGLVWDGNYDESDENKDFKNYTKYNNPHKLSCYLAAGIPVIVWEKAATAEFVKKENIGYLISNIYDINKIDFKDYEMKRKNVVKIGKKIRNGYYTKRVIEKVQKEKR